jgi:hypothetical protein
METIMNGPVDDTKHMANGDGNLPHVVTCSCLKFTC